MSRALAVVIILALFVVVVALLSVVADGSTSGLLSPVSQLSAPYRQWHYVNGSFDGFVVPPLAGGFQGQSLTDTAVVFEKTPEDGLGGGRYRMTYLFYNNTGKGSYGYEVALATSDDLIHWSFGHGGDKGIVFKRNPTPGTFDYGGVTLGGLHFDSVNIRAPRRLKKVNGNYHALYGCYPSRNGYEAGNGGQGVATSTDGVVWNRVSDTVPALSGGSPSLSPWEQDVVYQPFLLEHPGGLGYFNFYNARGVNEYGNTAEQSGLANLFPRTQLPGIDKANNQSEWVRNTIASPLISSGPQGSADTYMASDPKVFWDDVQGVWVMFYFGVGDSTHGHADIMAAFSADLITWVKDPKPLYKAGGHPMGIDAQHAHKVSVIYDDKGIGYMFYTAVGPKGRGIALLTSEPVVVMQLQTA